MTSIVSDLKSPIQAGSVDPALVLQFLYASITDMQAVIRALDTKLSIALVMLSIVLTKFDVLYDAQKIVLTRSPKLGMTLIAIFIFAWLAGIISALAGLTAIDNPSEHISNNSQKGTFYLPGLFQTKFLDSFFNFRPKSKASLVVHQGSLPENREGVFSELSLEQMKLAYIRSIKIRRVNTAFYGVVIAVAAASVFLLISAL